MKMRQLNEYGGLLQQTYSGQHCTQSVKDKRTSLEEDSSSSSFYLQRKIRISLMIMTDITLQCIK